jgi:hypothetical protein
VGRVQRLHHFEAIAGTVTEKHGELGHGCPDRPHDAGLIGHPLAYPLTPAEPSQVHLEHCFRQGSAGR